MEHLAARLATVPRVVAVTLGGSRAAGSAVEGSDWDFGLYYRGGLDPADITALGWPGRVFAPGEWGSIVNGGAWLTINGARVDLIYRDLDEVLHWTAAAGDGRFEIRREVGYVAGIATYVLAGEMALGRVLAGDLPRPAFPPKLRETAPMAWFRLAAGALSFADVYAGRQDRVACLANLCQAVLATAQGRLAVSSGVSRLVLLAGRGEPETELAEQAVRESGAELTIVRAAWFNQNFSEDFLLGPVLADEVALPAGEVPEPFVDADDIAEVAVAALTQDGHAGQLYELTGPRLLTFAEAVGEIAAAAGRPIRYLPVPADDYAAAAVRQGVPAETAELLSYLFREILDGRNAQLADGVQRALGRQPRDFASYARHTAASGVWDIPAA